MARIFICILRIHLPDLLLTQREFPDRDIGTDALRMRGLRDHRDPTLQVPAQDDLCRRTIIFRCKLLHERIGKVSSSQRRPCLYLNRLLRTQTAQIFLNIMQIDFDLIYGRSDVHILQPLQMVGNGVA